MSMQQADNRSSHSAISQVTLMNREVKHQYLKINNKMCQDLYSKLIRMTETEPDFDDVFNCPLIHQMKTIIDNVESPDCTLIDSIDQIGRALREDYNEECIPNLPNSQDIKQIQDQISQNLRVQIDNGLKLIPSPYLPANRGSKEYTLVLDLDETLLHFEEVSHTFSP